jgi:hypothetical protein
MITIRRKKKDMPKRKYKVLIIDDRDVYSEIMRSLIMKALSKEFEHKLIIPLKGSDYADSIPLPKKVSIDKNESRKISFRQGDFQAPRREVVYRRAGAGGMGKRASLRKRNREDDWRTA